MSYRPELLTHPGEIIKEHMEARGVTVADVAVKTTLTPDIVQRILDGERGIMPDETYQIKKVLGMTADFWKSLQDNYEQDVRRLTRTYPCPHPNCDGGIRVLPTIKLGTQCECICKTCIVERTEYGLKFVRIGRL